jgi:hypothetical protein
LPVPLPVVEEVVVVAPPLGSRKLFVSGDAKGMGGCVGDSTEEVVVVVVVVDVAKLSSGIIGGRLLALDDEGSGNDGTLRLKFAPLLLTREGTTAVRVDTRGSVCDEDAADEREGTAAAGASAAGADGGGELKGSGGEGYIAATDVPPFRTRIDEEPGNGVDET